MVSIVRRLLRTHVTFFGTSVRWDTLGNARTSRSWYVRTMGYARQRTHVTFFGASVRRDTLGDARTSRFFGASVRGNRYTIFETGMSDICSLRGLQTMSTACNHTLLQREIYYDYFPGLSSAHHPTHYSYLLLGLRLGLTSSSYFLQGLLLGPPTYFLLLHLLGSLLSPSPYPHFLHGLRLGQHTFLLPTRPPTRPPTSLLLLPTRLPTLPTITRAGLANPPPCCYTTRDLTRLTAPTSSTSLLDPELPHS